MDPTIPANQGEEKLQSLERELQTIEQQSPPVQTPLVVAPQPTQPITSPTPEFSQPTPSQPPKTSTPLPLLIALFVIVLLATAGYYLFSNGMLKIPGLSPTPTLVSTPTPSPDPTADWKTYVNTSSNYSLKYPADWKIENQAAGSFDNEPLANSTFVEIYKPQSDPTKSLGNIGFEEIAMIPPSEESLLTKTKTVNGLSMKCYGEEGLNSKLWCFVKVPNQDKYLNIHIFTNVDVEVNRTFDQILSTFRFIGAESKASEKITLVNGVYQDPSGYYSFTPPVGCEYSQYQQAGLVGFDVACSGKTQKEGTSLQDGLTIRTLIFDSTQSVQEESDAARTRDIAASKEFYGSDDPRNNYSLSVSYQLGGKQAYEYHNSNSQVFHVSLGSGKILQLWALYEGPDLSSYKESFSQSLSTLKFTN